MSWHELISTEQLDQLIEDSYQHPVAIFKHSTRCPTSSMAKSRLERDWLFPEDSFPIFHLDLIRFRQVSNAIAEKTSVEHQSPQLIILKEGKVVYDASHHMIKVRDIPELA